MNGKSFKLMAAMVLGALLLVPMAVYALDSTVQTLSNYKLTDTTYAWMNPVSIGYTKVDNAGDIKADDNAAHMLTGQTQVDSTGALPIYLKISDDKGNALNGGNWFTAFCVDIYQDIWGGANGSVSMIPVSAVHGGLQAAWLYNKYLDKAVAANDTAALGGLQVAIWEAITDDYTKYDLTKGNFFIANNSLNAAALKDANDMLAALNDPKTGFNATGLDTQFAIMHTASLQDQLIRYSLPAAPAGGSAAPATTPEPATMILVGIGMGLAGLRKMRK